MPTNCGGIGFPAPATARGFPPPPSLGGFFHPAPRSGFSLWGFSPPPGGRPGFPGPLHPLLPLDAAACAQRLRPRLQGFAPRRECGVGRSGLGLDRSAPLVGFSSSGCSPRATWECLHIPSALGLYRRSEEHTSELQSRLHLVCRLLL